MRRLIFSGIFLTCLIQTSVSQVSHGGTPPSFDYKSSGQTIDTREFPKPDMISIMKEDSADYKHGIIYKIGRIIPVDLNMENSGTWTTLPDGIKIWRLKIKSEGAKAIAVYYDKFRLPPKSRLFLYNEDRTHIIGAFTEFNNTESGEFATRLVKGETVTLEYVQPSSVKEIAIIGISGFSYTYRGVNFYRSAKDFGDSDFCEVNINCSPEGTNWQHQKRSVARILVVTSSYQGWCTGSLVNNVRQNCTSYFLTADHCYSNTSQNNLNQWVFYFNYEANGCSNPTNPSQVNDNYTITGCTMRSHGGNGGNSGSDFFLSTLNEPVPESYNLYFNGWSRSTTASPSGVSIHHPYGDIKKISTYTYYLLSSGWGIANTHWQVTWATTPNGHGVSEGGSSGSPIFDNNGYLIGTLTGGGSACVVNGAGTGTGPDVPDLYGKFSYHWLSNGTTNTTRLKPWLDPDNLDLITLNGKENICTTNPPVADFSADNTTIYLNGTVNFHDLSLNDPNHWKWFFEGAAVDSSMQQNPLSISFNLIGSFGITLIVTNSYGTDTVIKPGYITVLPTPPDLIVQNSQVHPNAIDAGDTLNVSCNIKNNGGNTAVASKVKIYLSSNSMFNPGTDLLMGTILIDSLQFGSSVQVADTFEIPDGTAGGTQYILFIADADNEVTESTETNNIAYKAFTINQYFPDLKVQNNNIDSLTIRIGNTTNTSCEVYNLGNTASVNSTLKLYLSMNNSWDATDTYLDEATVGPLEVLGSQIVEKEITIPYSVTVGIWYVLFFADANNDMVESNENNNVASKQISVISPSDISTLTLKPRFRIVPNPSEGLFYLVDAYFNGYTVIKVRNLLGQIVFHVGYIADTTVTETIDMTSYSDGVYFIEVSNSRELEIQRIIKE
jgi:PKD repeat protein